VHAIFVKHLAVSAIGLQSFEGRAQMVLAPIAPRHCDIAAEFHQVGMAYYSIRYIDRKSVSRITASALCEKDEIPRTVVGGSGFGCRRQSEAGTTRNSRSVACSYHFSPS
jgi:hypothetical protein